MKYESIEFNSFNIKGFSEIKLTHELSLFRFLFNLPPKVEIYESKNYFYDDWYDKKTKKKVGTSKFIKICDAIDFYNHSLGA